MSRDQWIVLGIAVWGFGILFVWCLFASGAAPQPAPRPKRAAPKPHNPDAWRTPEHRSHDCTGTWVQPGDDQYLMVCSGCRARAQGLVRVANAQAENARGRLLLALTAKGAAEMAAERQRKERAA